jgi:uncharacterized surface protein with fasciclin (FAS1) repeats
MQTVQNLLEAQNWPRTFRALHCAIKAVGLEYTLEGYKPVTLFAPDDKAFNQLHQVTIFDLLKGIPRLRRLLEYHIVPFKLTREALQQRASSPLADAINAYGQKRAVELPTISGHALSLTISHRLCVQGSALLEPELVSENGVIHPVQQVLWPPGMSEASFLR